MQRLNQDIKDKKFQSCYLLYGDEEFLKKEYKRHIKSAVVGDDSMNFTYLEDKDITEKMVIDMADTMPFFADKRLIIIENSGFFKKATEDIAEYILKIPETAIIVFVESEVDKRNKLYKAVNKSGHVVECAYQAVDKLSKWVLGIISKENKRITSNDMELFLSKTGNSMENIYTELEKLLSYTVGKDTISTQDIEAVCIEPIDNKIFDMINYVAIGDLNKALKLYRDLLISKEPPMRILFLIARQFNQLLQAKSLVQTRKSNSEIAAKLKVPPYVVSKILAQASGFDYMQLKMYVEKCVEFEELVKTGGIVDRLAVELLLTMQAS